MQGGPNMCIVHVIVCSYHLCVYLFVLPQGGPQQHVHRAREPGAYHWSGGRAEDQANSAQRGSAAQPGAAPRPAGMQMQRASG